MKKSKPTRETKAALIIERDALKIELAKSRDMAAKLASAVLEGERLEAKIAAARAQTTDAIERRRRREAQIQAAEMAAVTHKLLALEWIIEKLDASGGALETYWNAIDRHAAELAGLRN